VIRADAGEVRLDGQDITRLAPWRRARLGLIRTFQLAREFQRMTVLENLMLAPQAQLGERFWPIFLRRDAVRAQEAEVYRRACEVMEIATLTHLRDEYAGDLSGGQKKLLELARTLMIDCDLILLDEPGAGVNPALMSTLTDMIAQLCDPVVVMTQGSLLTKGSFDDLRRDPAVIEAYLGSVADG
jgi:branched-chain amino acid transport system ATP-binding protein